MQNTPKKNNDTVENKKLTSENTQFNESENIILEKSTKSKNYLLIFLISFFIICASLIVSVVILWRLLPSSHLYISDYLSQQTNFKVKIGGIQTKWGNWRPRIILHNVYLYDKKNTNKLWFSAKNIDVLLKNNSLSFLKLQPTFEVINLDKVYFLLQQQNNKWIAFNQKPSNEPLESFPKWLFDQDKINIRQATINAINQNQQQLNINFNAFLEKPAYTTHNNYLFKANANINGFNADLSVVFSPIYKESSFIGYFKEWEGDGKLKLNSFINKNDIQVYKNFFAFNKKSAEIFSNLQEINVVNSTNQIDFKWHKTIITQAQLSLNLEKIDAKIKNAKNVLMPNLQANISLSSMPSLNYTGQGQNNISLTKDLKNKSAIFSAEQLKFLSTQIMPSAQQYIWKIENIKWTNFIKQNKYLENIIISHPTHQLFPINLNISNSELNSFVEIFNHLPLGIKYTNTLEYINPKAKINNFQLIYHESNLPLLARIAINADIENFQFNYPQTTDKNLFMLGKNGFNIKMQGNIQKGNLIVKANNLLFNLNNMQAKQLNIDKFSSTVKWSIDRNIKIEATQLEANNKDMNIQANFTYNTQNNKNSYLESNGNFSIQDFYKIKQFLPLSLNQRIHDLFNDMNIHANIQQAKFKVAGFTQDLIDNFKENPKTNKSIFLIDIPLNNASFSIPHKQNIENNTKLILWPQFEKINGKLNINKSNMLIKVNNAKTAKLDIGESQVNLLSFIHSPIIQIKTQSHGKLSDMLDYVNNSPIHTLISKLEFVTTGDAKLNLNLNLPTQDLHKTTVNGDINLTNNDIQFVQNIPDFKNIQANIKFNEHGFNFDNANAKFMGEDIKVKGVSSAHEINIEGIGTLSQKGLNEVANFNSSIDKLNKYITGKTLYNAKLNIKDKKIKVDVTSDLNGLEINLPAPLNKKANQTKNLQFTWQMLDTNKHLERISLNYNNFAGIFIEQQRIEGKAKNIRGIYYADNDFNQDIPLPDEGIQAKINLDYINIDAWKNVYNNMKSSDKIAQNSANKEEDLNSQQDYMPRRIAAYTQTLRAMDREIKNIILGLARKNDGWSGNISSSHINGYVSIKPISKQYINGLIQGHFATVNIPNKEQKAIISNLLQEKVSDLPALDVKIDDFSMLEKKLGKIIIKTENIYRDNYKDWHIKEFSLQNDATLLTANGIWNFNTKLADKNNSRTNINIELKLNNTGEFLNQLGATQVLKKGNGILNASLNWSGSPVEFNYKSLNAKLNLNLKDGFILKVDPAAAKLLGIVSLQGLGNILTFHWNKLFAQGSPFDEIDSEAYIKHGILTTNHFKLDSPQAKVIVKGEINLLNETQNIQADIFPRINAGSASLAYSLINPAIGLGTLLAQVAFTNPLSKILKQSYTITGKWENPKVKHVSNNEDTDKNPAWQER